MSLRTPAEHLHPMPRAAPTKPKSSVWKSIPDPPDRYSTGIADFDRLLDGGWKRGSMALLQLDESIGPEDIDLLLFPTFLNFLYQSRGIIAVLPARDSPNSFRDRLTQYMTRKRFDSRVRIIEYAGEDEGPRHVVNLQGMRPGPARNRTTDRIRAADFKRMEAAERAAQGGRKRSFLEVMSFEVIDTLVGSEQALKMFFYGIKRARHVRNLVIGILRPGLGSAPGIHGMADTEFAVYRNEVGLVVRGVRPKFPAHLVSTDPVRGAPHVVFAPQPA
jgi:hypothetical protein